MLTTRKPVPPKPTKTHLCTRCRDTGTIERQEPRTIGRGSNGEVVYSTRTVTARFACDCRQGWTK